MLSRVQQGLEQLYRVAPLARVEEFVIDASTRERAGVSRSPREQLLLQEDEDGVAIGLYLDREVLGRLEGRRIEDIPKVLPEFLLLLEGVSHFVYLAFQARREQSVSAVELELQAEVDKYVTCLLAMQLPSKGLRRRLFREFEYEEDLAGDERERYRVANENAAMYSQSLERRFLRKGRTPEMLAELREFYRLSFTQKLHWIRQSARAA